MNTVALVLVFALACIASPVINKEFVTSINSIEGLTWTAGLNKGSAIDGASIEQVKAMCGAKKGGPRLPQKKFEGLDSSRLPTQFSSSENWPFCTTMKQIRDQSACGSCWAFGAVEAMSDRMCIFLQKNITLSSADLAFCCTDCGGGCEGGYPGAAWQYWVNTGIVEEGCWEYPFPSCDHHVPGSKNPCPGGLYPNKDCPNKCQSPSWNGNPWDSDHHHGLSAYSLQGEQDIMTEIYKNGPVETAFTVYADFPTYKSGVYKHTTGEALGGHAVKFMGWGVENGVKYWLVANSWNVHWGDNGYFKIIRGINDCGIEDEISAGIPRN